MIPKQLFDLRPEKLLLELRELEMKEGTKISFIHVSVTRMIAQESDGLSRENLIEGVMKGAAMEDFIPLKLTALERSNSLKDWILSWTGKEVDRLSPEDWFVKGHDLRDGEFEKNSDGLKLVTHPEKVNLHSDAISSGCMCCVGRTPEGSA